MERSLDAEIDVAKKMLKELVGKYGERSKLFSQAQIFNCPGCGHAEQFSLGAKISVGEYGVAMATDLVYNRVFGTVEMLSIPMLALTCKCKHEEVLNISLSHALREIRDVQHIAEKGRTPPHLLCYQ